MRKSVLNRLSTAVVVVLITGGVTFSLARAPSESAHEHAGGNHAHENDHQKGLGNGPQSYEDNCAQYHFSESTQTKIGPGLERLFDCASLPVSGRPVSAGNVHRQLNTPYGNPFVG